MLRSCLNVLEDIARPVTMYWLDYVCVCSNYMCLMVESNKIHLLILHLSTI